MRIAAPATRRARPDLRAGLLVLLLALGGCGDASDGLTSARSQLHGAIRVDGDPSATVVGRSAGEQFVRFHPDARVLVDGTGEDAAVRRACAGEVDVVVAAPPAGVAWRGPVRCPDGQRITWVQVGADALVVIAGPRSPVACISTARLRALASRPSSARGLVGAIRGSGVQRRFSEGVGLPSAWAGTEVSEDDGALIDAVAASGDGLGYARFGAVRRARRAGVRAVRVDDGAGCVAPTADAIRRGAYRPFSRSIVLGWTRDGNRREVVRSFAAFAAARQATINAGAKTVPLDRTGMRRAVAGAAASGAAP